MEQTETQAASETEAELRRIWTEKGVSKERQDELVASITAKAQSGAAVGPFTILERLPLHDGWNLPSTTIAER